MLTTPWAAESEAACTARATSRTSTKSRCTPRPLSLSSPSPACMARRIASARRPSGEPAGVPGPTGENTRSTTASSPEPRTSSVAASFDTPYGPPGRGTASSAVEEPGWLGPYSEAQPTWTSRAPQPLRRRASQTVATATVLCRVRSRAPPRVAPAQFTTTPGWTASRKRVSAPGLPEARSKRTSASSPRPSAVRWTAGSASSRSATKRPMKPLAPSSSTLIVRPLRADRPFPGVAGSWSSISLRGEGRGDGARPRHRLRGCEEVF